MHFKWIPIILIKIKRSQSVLKKKKTVEQIHDPPQQPLEDRRHFNIKIIIYWNNHKK